MSLRIEHHQAEGITIVALIGRLVLGEEASVFRSAIEALSPDDNRLLIDLAGVSFIDSTGLGLLVGVHSRVAKAGGAVRLLHASKKHMELLILTKLTTIFQIYDDERDAIDSFFPDRERRSFDILDFVTKRETE